MLKTLAAKHESSVAKMARKYKAVIQTPHGRRICFEATVERAGRKPLVVRFGGIPLKRRKRAVLVDRPSVPITPRRKQLIDRLQAGWCELCDQRSQVEVHQGPRTRRSHQQIGTATARVGGAHGGTTAQDPGGLPAVPFRHPRRTTHRAIHGVSHRRAG